MNTTKLKTPIIGFILVLIFSCQSEKQKARIEFPTIDFTINTSSDTTIFGAQGTRIFIGANTFQFENGELATDSVRIELKEYYTKADIILAKLSTESNGIMLETGGMLNIQAFSNDEALEIKSDKRITIHFPKKKHSSQKMDLFYPDTDKAQDTAISNWNVDTINLVKRTLKLGSFGWWHPDFDDSTGYDFKPKNFIDTGYYWNPLDFYVKSYNFSDETIKEISKTKNNNYDRTFATWNDFGVECEMYINRNGYIMKPTINTKISRSARREILNFLNDIPQLEPGKNKYNEIIQRKGLLFIQSGNIVPLYQTDAEYIKSFDAKYEQYEDKPIKNLDDAELNYYIFSVSKLGWINCDRFMEFEEKVDLIVEAPADSELKMVFSEFEGILKPKIMDGTFIFKNIPVGQNATIVGIDNSSNGLLAAFQPITIDDKPISKLHFSEITLKELKNELNLL